MRTILCYGDSNTHGYNPKNGLRFPYHVRWTGKLADLLGPEYHVIEAGLNGRTTVLTDPLEPYVNGGLFLHMSLRMHKPEDLVIIMLGSNDLKRIFGEQTARQIAENAGKLVEKTKELTASFNKEGIPSKILLVSPIEIGEGMAQKSVWKESFGGESAVIRSRQFPEEFEKEARRQGVYYMNAAAYAQASKRDSLHLDEEGHEKLAMAMYHKILEIFQEEDQEAKE